MPVLGVDYQAKVKNPDNVLVGVAQIRIGLPSIRSAVAAVVGVPQAVTQSAEYTDATDGVTKFIRPTRTPNTGTAVISTPAVAYTGKYDGCFIIRITGAGATGGVDVYAPNGYRNATTLTAGALTAFAPKMNSTDASGITITATFTSHAIGDTWVIPCWSPSAMDNRQTCLVTPYSPFMGSGNSVGGLKGAQFQPKLDGQKLLETGFPEETDDRIITKTSASVKFDALEYTNNSMIYLRDMVSQICNEAKTPAISCEVVMRTRGNSLITYWVPNCGLNNIPTFAPTNDYSTLSWELEAFSQCELQSYQAVVAAELSVFNVWLRNSWMFYELCYTH